MRTESRLLDVLDMASGAGDAAWLAGWSTLALAILAIATAIVAVAALFKQNRQLGILKAQAEEEHKVNIRQLEVFERQMEVFDAELVELREAPNIREREALERQAIEERRAEEQRQAEVRDAAEREQRRDAEEREAKKQRRAQAERVVLIESHESQDPRVTPAQKASGVESGPVVIATIRNGSEAVIRGVTYTWHKGAAPWGEFDRLGDLMPNGGEATRVRALPDGLPGYVNPEAFGAVAYFTDAAGVNWRVRPDGELHEIPVGQPMP
jgi:hypothetical protein